ncbi:Transcriptional activator protein CzcR [Anatilimnocola aggregata]|uniref:Transcriptional activator protein CzcR n=1 Tax=Anatilimnocola aggregata TaxID=2528021 RepID=A0A517YB95_9BACT|nr:response regulator transcription factor [Anatilimnocola aggregata]QDU27484.1 Transcriptional activator protein CzcR [Anatilimnocola aggregata]
MRVLIIEDEPDLRRLIAEVLCEADYAVDIAADGQDGLTKALSWSYDAIVLDLMLPKLDGWKLLAQLRREKATPVLIVSARDSVRDRVEGLDLGADDYLIKPFERAELLARLRALIRRAAGQSVTELTIGEVRIDLRSRTVLLGQEPIVLTSREYVLLEYLALHRGRVVSRTELFDHLFDENENSLSNLLDVHVSNIRKKLGHELIETRRGLGYVIPE